VEIPPEPFEIFKSQKESLDRLYEWEKRLYEEVRVRARLLVPLFNFNSLCVHT
jgi:hypothetical protein